MTELHEEFQKLSLTNIANGAAAELFDKAMDEVLENVLDENRDATVDRTITLSFKIKSNLERNMAVIAVQSKTSLAPVNPAASTLFFKMERGKAKAYTHNVHQPSLFDSPVRPLRNEEK
jgi:hypothetical protein